jgi:alpha-glucosidase
VLAYVRTHAGQRCLVVLNLGAQPHSFTSDQVQIQGHVALSTHLDRVNEDVRGTIALRGDEGVIVTLA